MIDGMNPDLSEWQVSDPPPIPLLAHGWLKIVVSPVRVWVSPDVEVSFSGGFLVGRACVCLLRR
jgi:hypothetical protein